MRPLRILLAPDAFKGSLSAPEAAQAMARGFRRVFPDARLVECPVADGGEGTVRALVSARGGLLRRAVVSGPQGDPVEAVWGDLGRGQAVIEVAEASGWTRVPADRRDPRAASTRGTGELLRAVLEAGPREILVGLGGSATTDGGAGLLRALGARFLDAEGRELPEGGAALARLSRIDLRTLDPRLAEAEILVATDVDNPLIGPRGAAAVFGPQKGASPEVVRELDAALATLARIATEETGRHVAEVPGAGAAGGLGAGLLWFTPARLRPGVDLVLEAMAFERRLRGVDLVITGEGRTDAQTSMGKAPGGVAAAARRQGVPVVCLSGGLGDGADLLLDRGVTVLAALPPGPMALEECLGRAAELLEGATERLARTLRLGRAMGRTFRRS